MGFEIDEVYIWLDKKTTTYMVRASAFYLAHVEAGFYDLVIDCPLVKRTATCGTQTTTRPVQREPPASAGLPGLAKLNARRCRIGSC